MSTVAIASILFLMVAGHFLVDFALQTNRIAIYKNRHADPSEIFGPNPPTVWPWILSSHAFQHGAVVFLVTHSLTLGLCETVAHFVTDFGKCEHWYGYHADQCIHLGTKVLWVVLLVKGLA